MSTGSKRFSRTALVLIAVAAVGLVVLAVAVASGGGGGAYGGSASSATAPSSGGGGPSVKLASTGLGKVLVDARGRTLYLFEADKGTMSACSGACASAWPPLITKGKPAADAGVSAAKLGTTERGDGTTQVTYDGHPLYTYAGDAAPGQTRGQGLDQFGAEWYVLAPSGAKIDDD